MSVQNYLEQMRKIQEEILNILNKCSEEEECFENLKDNLDHLNDQHQIKSVLHLIANIANNHLHVPNFFNKIEKIILIFKSNITQHFSNSEIFNIFKKNKRILLFLIEEKMMIIDDYVFHKLTKSKYTKAKYPQYFWPEIRDFITKNKSRKNEEIEITPNLFYSFDDFSTEDQEMPSEDTNDEYIDFEKNFPDNFEQKRKIGENESQICELIRNDLVKEFIVYVNKTNVQLTSIIKPSIFETNQYLIQNEAQVTLIDYATFFGAIQIFNYLTINKVELSPSLWNYAIHGSNSEIIHFLEDNHIKPSGDSYKECLQESIKCHHNDIAIYFMNNFFFNDEKEYLNDSFIQSIKKYNFAFIQSQLINASLFPLFCKYDFYPIVELLLNENNVDINKFAKNDSNDAQKNVLYLAIEKENIDICRLLLSCQNICVNNGYKVSTSKEHGNYKWDRSTETINEEKSMLFNAIECENLDIVKLLLKHNNINVDIGYTKEIQRKSSRNPKLKEQKKPLFLAVEKGNIEIVKLLLPFQNTSDNYGLLIEKDGDEKIKKTPLFKAVENENIEIIQLLLSNDKTDINYINKFLIPSSNPEKEFDDDQLDAELVEYRSSSYKWYDDVVESFSGNEKVEETALCFAVEQNKKEITQLLLISGKVDVNIPCKYRKNWIFTRCYEGDTEPGILGEETKHALYIAVENENNEIVQQLMAHANLDINYININHYIEIKSDSYRGDQKSIKLDFEEEKTALFLSIKKGKFEIINLLLANEKVDINIPMKSKKYWNYRSRANGAEITDLSYDEKKEKIEEKTMLYLAIEEKNIDLIKKLISKEKIEVNKPNNFYSYWTKNPVYYNEFDRYDEEEQRKIKPIYEKINVEKTVLHFAIETQDIEIIELLLSSKNIDPNHLYYSSNINKKLGKGHVILDYDDGDYVDRSYDRNDQCVKWYQNIERIEKKTPLYLAVEEGNLDICRALLANNDIDINLQSTETFQKEINKANHNDLEDYEDFDEEEEDGEEEEEITKKIEQRTSLHLAVNNEDIEIIRLLLNNQKIDINSKDENGSTPIEYTKNEKIIEMFKH